MKVELKEVLGALVVIVGFAVGYGAVQKAVEDMPRLSKLADTNMNDIIVLKTQMNLLVTPDMRIVPSPRVNSRLERLEEWMAYEKQRKEEKRLRELSK